MMIGMQLAASLCMTMMAMSQVSQKSSDQSWVSAQDMRVLIKRMQGGAYTAPAIAASAYTVATINNSFDSNLMGMVGFLDSPVS